MMPFFLSIRRPSSNNLATLAALDVISMKTHYVLKSSFFFFSFFFFLPPSNVDANQQLDLTLLHNPRIELTPNSFHSSTNLLLHLLFSSSISHTILFHVRSFSPFLTQ